MKRILWALAALTLAASCQKYEYNTDFSAPDTLESPQSVSIDLGAASNIVLSWTGGGAADGGICLYNVLFDKADGDFSNPLATMTSDNGGLAQLSLTHASLNNIARAAGISPLETGSIKWTVSASRGGEVKWAGTSATISVTRPDGIDNIPEHLYLDGTAAASDGQGREFRIMSEGVFRIYTTLEQGSVFFRSSMSDDAFTFFFDSSTGTLREGSGETGMDATGTDELVRITLDFNARTMSVDRIGKTVRCIWGATFGDIAVLTYEGGGDFVGDGDIVFLVPGGPGAPDWLSWVEERYYFLASVNGGDMIWGRYDDVSAERPVGGEEPYFYSLKEMVWDQWTGLWKMGSSLDNTHATITIHTNSDNLMLHTFTDVTPL